MAFAPQASRHLNWEIAQLYTKGWMIWGILTWLGGLAVLFCPIRGSGPCWTWYSVFFGDSAFRPG